MKEKDGVFIPKSKSPLYGEEIRVNLNYKTIDNKSVLKKMYEDKKIFSETIKGGGDIIGVSKELDVNLANPLKIDNK